MRIGVCLSFPESHIQYLPKCLENIENQTRKPDIVSIHISGTVSVPSIAPCSFPTVVHISPDPSTEGQGRNAAAAAIQEQVDILTFCSVKNVLHSRRLEMSERHFKNSAIDVFIHAFMDYSSLPSGQEKASLPSGQEKASLPSGQEGAPWILASLPGRERGSLSGTLHTQCFTTTKDIMGPIKRLHLFMNGSAHIGVFANRDISLYTRVWKQNPMIENMTMGEDSLYNYILYTRGYAYGYSPDTLTYFV
jgi:hypothetical protein